MKLKLPYYSQLDVEIPASSQRQACGICCVKMILDFYNPNQENTITNLLKEAKLIKAFDEEKKIWLHEGLTRILRNHKILAYPQEFRSVKVDLKTEQFLENENQNQLIERGIQKIISKLQSGHPVIASVSKGFSENIDSHIIVINGYKKEDILYFIVSDPLIGSDQMISADHFLDYWRKFVIFVEN